MNGLPDELAHAELLKCCGSHRWARAVAERRPFGSMDELLAAADEEWWKLEHHDWIEAFSHHPRIGERARAQGFAKQEQSGTSGASDKTLLSLESLNRLYEEKFGHVFLISASGKTADEMLDALRTRMLNRRDVELRNAAAEQAKITRLRLEKLMSADPRFTRGD